MADSYVIVEGQNLLALQNKINEMLGQGYQPLQGTFAQVNTKFYQGMANLTGIPVPFGNVTGISDLFRQISAISDKDLLRQAVGSVFIGYNKDNAKPGDWQPTADEIKVSDMVRMLLKTSTAAGMRSITGAGTSNLIIGYGADEAKPGNWKPDVSDITGASQVIEALLESNNEAGARAAIGAGTSNLKTGTGATDAKPGDWLPKGADIQGLSAVLASLMSAADAATARQAIGAGTSSLTVGNDSTQAKAGNWKPVVADVTDITLLAVQNLLKNTGSALSVADRTVLKSILGFGQSDLTLGSTSVTAKAGDWKPASADISDVTSSAVLAFMRYAGTDLTAAQQLALRNIMGAGTSSLAIGTTATTAKAGNYAPAAEDISNSGDIGRAILKAATVAAALQAISGNLPQTGKFLRADGTWQDPPVATYAAATTTANGLMSATDKQKLDNIAGPVFTVVAAGGRPIDTAFMIDSARHADVTYSFAATLNATITAAQNVQIDCQVDGQTVARLAIGITLTLAVTVGMTLPFTHSATFRVPAGKQVKFVKTGTAAVTVSVAAGQEVLL